MPVVKTDTVLESDDFGDVFDFNFRDITNSGANRFWFDEKNDVLKVAGSDVRGRESFDDVNDFLDRAIELYDGSANDTVNYDGSGELGYGLKDGTDNVVKFGVANVHGSTLVTFDDAKDAQNFLEFVDVLDQAGFF